MQRNRHLASIQRLSFAHMAVLLFLNWTLPVSANEALNGVWQFNAKRSDDLQEVMEQIRRDQKEEQDQREEEQKKRQSRPGIFGKTGSWDDRRAMAATAPIPKLMRTMISSEQIKIYFSRKLAISYDKEIKRLLTPNPHGRVYSATGAGLSKDSIGESLSYIEDDVLYIETRTSIGKIREKFDALSEPGTLIVTWDIDAPAIERPVTMTTVYDKK